MILFGLSMVDEMDRDAFGLLIPNIRDAFHMTDAGILSLVAVASLLGLSLTVPIAYQADRGNRVRLMLIGATVFAVFSVGTGLACVDPDALPDAGRLGSRAWPRCGRRTTRC